jgi:hypothetical protein
MPGCATLDSVSTCNTKDLGQLTPPQELRIQMWNPGATRREGPEPQELVVA